MVYVICNVGGVERTVRMVGGAALLGLGLAAPMKKPWKIAAGAVGAMELMTGITAYCPVNVLLHRNTCPTAHRPHE